MLTSASQLDSVATSSWLHIVVIHVFTCGSPIRDLHPIYNAPILGVHKMRAGYFTLAREKPDLKYWENSHLLLAVEDFSFANNKIGSGAPPVKTEKGWLTVVHTVDLDPARGKNGWEDER